MWVIAYLSQPVSSAGTDVSMLFTERRPAIRVWGDLLIRLRARQQPMDFRPPLAVRLVSLFAWSRAMPYSRINPTGRTVHVRIDPRKCATADACRIDPMFSWSSWAQLTEYLIDEIVSYFSAQIDAYLETWTTLADLPDDQPPAGWEVAVPREGALEVFTQ